MAERRALGENERALAARLRQLPKELIKERPTYVALARHLARALDDGAGLSTAAVAREYRNALAALEAEQGDVDDGSARLRDFLSEPEVGDPS